MMTRDELLEALDEMPRGRSAWSRAVHQYAREMVEDLDEGTTLTRDTARRVVLNGAADARQYSEGGCTLVYDSDIAERVCTPTELRQTKGGTRPPNREETWLDVQTRAINQALAVIRARVRPSRYAARRELATVLAALRYWQNAQDVPLDIYDIATEAGEPLTHAEIDDLCERLNT